MKKILFICLFLIYFSGFVLASDIKGETYIAGYKKSQTISLNDFLYAKESPKNWKHLRQNKKGDVIYRNKVIITDNGKPINDNTASESYLCMKILFIAQGIQPRKGCDTSDYYTNGIYGLGCYIDNPDEK